MRQTREQTEQPSFTRFTSEAMGSVPYVKPQRFRSFPNFGGGKETLHRSAHASPAGGAVSRSHRPQTPARPGALCADKTRWRILRGRGAMRAGRGAACLQAELVCSDRKDRPRQPKDRAQLAAEPHGAINLRRGPSSARTPPAGAPPGRE
jgi:hypothetical protein